MAAELGVRTRGARFVRERGAKYLAVGLFNTGFGYAVFALLTVGPWGGVPYLVALLVAHVVAVLTAFVLYRWYVFKVRGHLLRDLFRFWSVYLFVLVGNAAVLALGVESMHLHPLLVQGVVVIVTPVLTYLAHSRFSFVREAEGALSGSPPTETSP